MIAAMITIFYICIGTVRVNEDEHDDDIAVNCLLIMEIFAQITLHGAASARAVHFTPLPAVPPSASFFGSINKYSDGAVLRWCW